MCKVIGVEELISKLYDPRVVHMDENGRVKREDVIMVINGLAEEYKNLWGLGYKEGFRTAEELYKEMLGGDEK